MASDLIAIKGEANCPDVKGARLYWQCFGMLEKEPPLLGYGQCLHACWNKRVFEFGLEIIEGRNVRVGYLPVGLHRTPRRIQTFRNRDSEITANKRGIGAACIEQRCSNPDRLITPKLTYQDNLNYFYARAMSKDRLLFNDGPLFGGIEGIQAADDGQSDADDKLPRSWRIPTFAIGTFLFGLGTFLAYKSAELSQYGRIVRRGWNKERWLSLWALLALIIGPLLMVVIVPFLL
jgi:hypothetical protein